jgi:hypothetical protein
MVVELDGKTRKLSAIQAAELDLVVDPKPQMENSSESKPRRFERLPLK